MADVPFETVSLSVGAQTTITDTKVSVAPVGIDDESAIYKNDPENINIFTDYMVESRYESDKHIYMMPITSPGGFNGASVAFAQLAAPTLLWIVDWTAARFNKPPTLPDPTPIDPAWVFLDEHYEPVMLALAPDGVTPLYRISGTYVYGHKQPNPKVILQTNFSRPPWMEDKPRRDIDPSIYEKKITDT